MSFVTPATENLPPREFGSNCPAFLEVVTQSAQSADNDDADGRTIQDSSQERRPALIARCRDVADLFVAVNFARDHALACAIENPDVDNVGPTAHEAAFMIDISSLTGIHAKRLRRALSRHSALTLEAGFRSHSQ